MNVTRSEPAEILILDEDSLAMAGATAALEAASHIVYQARDRATAVRIARVKALDLMICDLSIAGNSGLALTRELRLLPGMQDVPVMFVSRTQMPDIVRRSHDAGAAYYLRKPIDTDVLVDLVGKALWLPHLVETRLSMHEPARRVVPAPRAKTARSAVVQGIRLPLA
jgi:DNA-binding NarL/FixJ family response regulator